MNGDGQTKGVMFRLEIEEWKALKIAAVEDGETVQGILSQAVKEYLAKHARRMEKAARVKDEAPKA